MPTRHYTGAGGLTVAESGNVQESGAALLLGKSDLTGPTYIPYGTLDVDGSQPESAVTVTGTLGGTGTVSAITCSDTDSQGGGETITGSLTAEGDVTLISDSTFAVALNGAIAKSD